MNLENLMLLNKNMSCGISTILVVMCRFIGFYLRSKIKEPTKEEYQAQIDLYEKIEIEAEKQLLHNAELIKNDYYGNNLYKGGNE